MKPLATLALSLAAGVILFLVPFVLFVAVLGIYAPAKPDPSAFLLGWVVAGCGALFGFERWWSSSLE